MVKKSVKSKKRIDKEDHSGLFIPGGIFLGMGAGFLTNQLVAGLFIGMGCGFIAMAVYRMMKK